MGHDDKELPKFEGFTKKQIEAGESGVDEAFARHYPDSVAPVYKDIQQGLHSVHDIPAGLDNVRHGNVASKIFHSKEPHVWVRDAERGLRSEFEKHPSLGKSLRGLDAGQVERLEARAERIRVALAAPREGVNSVVLGSHDFVGTTFYIACNMMLAFSVFFFMERNYVPKNWGTSVLAAGIVTFIAFYNYCYMKDVWVQTQSSPTVYRYTDWLITVPIQVMEFYFVLNACGAQTGNLSTRLMVASLVMLAAGWLAETDVLDKVSGFVFGMLGWLYIVNEVQRGEAGQQAAKLATGGGRQAFNTVRDIVSIGWIIYPVGYALAYIIHGKGWAPNSYGEEMLVNIMYNLADLVNKGAFGMAIWAAAKSDQRA